MHRARAGEQHLKAGPNPPRGNTQQVSLGFEATQEEFLSYDKGIDPTTGKAKWGAILGPYRFRKRQDFGVQLAQS